MARFILGVLDQYLSQIAFRPVAVNAEPGLAVLVRGRLIAIWSIRTDGVRILDGYVVMNPDKLPNLQLKELS